MAGKKGLFGYKFAAMGILVCLIIGGAIPLMLSLTPVFGDVQNGILMVNSDVNINTATYTIKGIDVGTGGTLTITNTTVKLQMDAGPDGTIGTADDNDYGIQVHDGGTLIMENCVLTVATTQTNPYLYVVVDVVDSTLKIKNTTVQCAGVVQADNSKVFILNSDFWGITPPSTVTDTDFVDDGMSLYFEDSDNVTIIDSSFNDAPIYTSNGIDYRFNNTEAWLINTFLDIDFRDPQGSTASNKVDCYNGADVHFYACGFNETKNNGIHGGPAIVVNASLAYIYRLASIFVSDLAGVPISDQVLDIDYNANQTPIAAPTYRILKYLDKTSLNWFVTDASGFVTAPLLSDTIRPATLPNSDFVGRYLVNTTVNSVDISTPFTLSGHPGDGDLDMTGANYPALNVTAMDHLKNPVGDSFYNSPLGKYNISTKKTLTGSYSVVGGKVYNSYFSLNKNLVVEDGGDLTIRDTFLHLLQDSTNHYYIVVEGNGKLTLDNVTVASTNGEPVNIYLRGTGTDNPTLVADEATLNINTLTCVNSGTIDMYATDCFGSFYTTTNKTMITLAESYVNNSFIKIDDAIVDIDECQIMTDDLSIMDCEFSAVNSTFDQALEFSGFNPEIIQVVTPDISALGGVTVDVQYWVNVNVVDRYNNPLAGALVNISQYDDQLNLVHITSGVTIIPAGNVIFPLIEKTISASNVIYKGNYFAEGFYQTSKGKSELLMAQTTDVNITINGAPELHPQNLSVAGSLIQGDTMTIYADVNNSGNFSASSVLVEFFNNAILLDSQILPIVPPGAVIPVSAAWPNAVYGQQNITVAVDPYNTIGELDETNNNITGTFNIGYGPDYSVNLVASETHPTQGKQVNFTATVRNYGQIDVQLNPITVTFYLNSKQSANVLYQTIIPAVGNTPYDVIYPHTFTNPQIYTVIVEISSKYDANMFNNENQTSVEVLSPADLVIDDSMISFSRPSPVGVGQNVGISITFYNLGSSDAKNFNVDILDKYTTVQEGTKTDKLVTLEIGLVKAGSQFSYNYTGWTPMDIGTHEIIVRLDSAFPSAVTEVNESNNNASKEFVIGSKPDLVFDSDVTFNPTEVTEGEFVDITVKCRNVGGTPATGFTVKFYIGSGSNLINFTTIDLKENSAAPLTISYRASAIGTNLFLAYIDEDEEITEINETNNQITKNFVVITKPDLVVTKVEFLDEPPIANGILTKINITILNDGETDASRFEVAVYDGNPNAQHKSVGQLSYLVTGIPAEESHTFTVTWNTTEPGGTHYIYVKLDINDDIKESKEFNNIVYEEVYLKTIPDLGVAPGDITVYAVTGTTLFPVDTIGNGKSAKISAMVHNYGDTDAYNFTVTFYRSYLGSKEGRKNIGEYTVSTLAGNSEMEVFLPGSAINFPTPGNATITVELDRDDNVKETVILNNEATEVFEVFGIIEVPDLEIGEITIEDNYGDAVTDTTIDGNLLEVSITIENKGGKDMNTHVLLSLFSEDPRGGILGAPLDFTAASHIGNITVPFVEAENFTVNMTEWMMKGEGVHELHMFIDSTGKVKEFDEDDNYAFVSVNASQKPDFYVQSFDYPAKLETDEKGKFIVQVGDLNNVGFSHYEVMEVVFNLGPDIIRTPLNADGSAEVEYSYAEEGTFNVVVEINVGSPTVPETSTSNNEDFDEITVKEPVSFWEKYGKILIPVIAIVVLLILAVVGGLVWFFVFRKKSEGPAVCSECGKFLDLEARECPNCGAEFSEEVECGECGGLMDITDLQCPHCDAVFGEPDEEALPEPGEADAAAAAGADGPPTPDAAAQPPVTAQPDAAAPATAADAGAAAAPAAAADGAAAPAAGDEDVAECYMCGSIIPLSAPMCPVCGAEFE